MLIDVLIAAAVAISPALAAGGPGAAAAPAAENCGRVRSIAVSPGGDLFYEAGPPGRGRLAFVAAGSSRALVTGVEASADLISGGGKVELAGDRVIVARATELFEAPVAGLKDKPAAKRFSGAPAPPHREEDEIAGLPEAAEYNKGVRGDGGPIRAARYGKIQGIAADPAGNLFVSEYLGAPLLQSVRVRFLNLGTEPVTFYRGTSEELVVAPGTIQSIAGRFGSGNGGDGGPARRATISGIGTPAAGKDRLYIAGWGAAAFGSAAAPGARPGPLVRVINLGGAPLEAHGQQIAPGAIATVAGGGPAGLSGDGSFAVGASFSYVTGAAADDSGNLYLADRDNSRVRKVGPDGILTTVAGTGPGGPGRGGFNGNDLAASAARLDVPVDVAVAGESVFVSDEGNEQIRVVDAGGVIRLGPGQSAEPSDNACMPAAGPAPVPAESPGSFTRRIGIVLIAAAAVLAAAAFRPRRKKGVRF